MAAAALSSCRVSLPSCSRRHGAQRAGRQQRQQVVAAVHGTPAHADVGDLHRFQQLWTPPAAQLVDVQARGGAPAAAASAGDDHKPRTPPPDLPSLLLDSRIVYLGMPLVPAVTELIIAEMLYLQHKDRFKPLYLYINSTGTTRADGETVGFETEGTAIYDTMCFIKNEVHTVGVGVAIGQSCMLLSAGEKGKRFMLEHATAMLHQPRVPPTGQRQAIEIQIKWREVLAQKQNMLNILSRTTGHSAEKLDQDMQRPLYMQPADAKAYNVIDGIVTPEKKGGTKIIDDVKSADQWDKEAGLVARQVADRMWANRNAIAHLVLLAMAYGATAYQCDCTGRSNCMCPSLEAPGGMDPSDVPQFILFTHDDGIVPLTERSFRDVADSRRNPNGCPVRATMFTTSQDTDCDLAYGMWRDGYEIATHTADHTQMPEGFPKNDTLSEILGAKQFLTRQCGIPADEIRGFRSPFLVTNPTVRQVLWENGFLYDSTLLEAVDSESVSTSMADRVWPYTLDFGIAQNCAWFSDTQTCKATERWPGLWEVPLWVLKVLGLEFTMDVGFYGGRGVYEPLKAAFDAAYNGNRAPVPIYVHTTWVEKQPSRLDELKEFADYTLEKGDVYWVTMAQLLAWMKNPVPASQLRKSKAMCARPQAAQPTPQLPLNGANVTLTFKGATQTQVADQQQRLVAAVAELLGTAAADTFVVGTAGGPAAQNAVSAQSLEDGSHVQVTLAASGADPMVLYQHAAPQATRDALDAQLTAMGFESSGEAVVVPFRNGVAMPTGAPAAAPVLAPTPAPAPVRVPGLAPAAMPAAKPAASPAAAVTGPGVVTEPAAAPAVVTPATTTSGDSTAAAASAAAPGSAATTSSSASGLSAGAIAGIAVGGVLIAVVMGLAVWTLAGWRLRRSPSDKHLAASSVGEPGSSRTSFTSSRGSPRKGSRNGSPTRKGGSDKLDIVANAV